jgi:hypothetical protein
MLEQFQFEDEMGRIQAEVCAGGFDKGRAADVRPNELVSGGDMLTSDGSGGHGDWFSLRRTH